MSSLRVDNSMMSLQPNVPGSSEVSRTAGSVSNSKEERVAKIKEIEKQIRSFENQMTSCSHTGKKADDHLANIKTKINVLKHEKYSIEREPQREAAREDERIVGDYLQIIPRLGATMNAVVNFATFGKKDELLSKIGEVALDAVQSVQIPNEIVALAHSPQAIQFTIQLLRNNNPWGFGGSVESMHAKEQFMLILQDKILQGIMALGNHQ